MTARRWMTGAAVLVLGAAGLAGMVATAVPASADVTNMTIVDVELFNHTDPGAVDGYLQAAVDVQYVCANGTTNATITAEYANVAATAAIPMICNGTAVEQRVYAAMQPTDHKQPARPGDDSLSAGVGYSYDGGGGGAGTRIAATVAQTELQPALTDLFPVWKPHYTPRQGRPSQVQVTFGHPLTLGGQTINNIDSKFNTGNGHDTYQALHHRIIHSLNPNRVYNIAITIFTQQSDAASSGYTAVRTPPRLYQQLELHASHTTIQPHHSTRLYGQVRPAHGGDVTLERRIPGGWHEIGPLHLSARGTFSDTVYPRAGTVTYRVTAPKSLDFNPAASSGVTVHVHS